MHNNVAAWRSYEKATGLVLGRLLQHTFKDQPWLLWESGETSCAAQNSHEYRSIMPSINNARISTYTEAIQTLEL